MQQAPAKAGRAPGAYTISPQQAGVSAIVLRGLAVVIRDRRMTSPKMRALLRQPPSSDGLLRGELAAIKRWDGDVVKWRRLLVLCDALGCDAGDRKVH